VDLHARGAGFEHHGRSHRRLPASRTAAARPTRWSINPRWTPPLGATPRRRGEQNPLLNEYRIYEFSFLGNRFVILLTPSSWRYEWIERGTPTAGTPTAPVLPWGSDWEGYGRTTYASIGGCYYAVRLAANRVPRTRAAAGRRDRHCARSSQLITPLGVWITAKAYARLFRRPAEEVHDLEGVPRLHRVRFTIRLDDWIRNSQLLSDALHQEGSPPIFQRAPESGA